MAGPFSTEGSFTKNTEAEVQEMLRALDSWSNVQTRPSSSEIARRLAASLPLVESAQTVDIPGFMGDWFVIANIPTPLEVGTSNNIEHYDWDEKNKRIQVTFTYTPGGSKNPSQAFMRGYIKNAPLNTRWSLDVKVGFYLPLGLTYLIPYIDDERNEYVIVSVPDRSYLWIMTRGRPLPANTAMPEEVKGGVTYLNQDDQDRIFQVAVAKAVELGFNADKIVRVPWTSL